MKNIVVLGSTGSIGTQTLDVAARAPEKFRVVALAVRSSVEKLTEQVRKFRPRVAVVYDETAYRSLLPRWQEKETRLVCGMEGLLEAVSLEEADIVVTAMVGMIGLRPTIRAIEAGKDIALANKETLVCAGRLIMDLAREKGVRILPVDSEHGAIFQCLAGIEPGSLHKIILTASGGPFRGMSGEALTKVKKEQALKHPNWNMGAKITIDSASMVNKGLEMIEARWLFDCPPDRIQVLVHPQSIVHSMIELTDGSVLAQLAVADMRLPIQVALEYPQRGERVVEPLDLAKVGTMTFEKPDEEVFVALPLAREAMRRGGLFPAALNAANECAVSAFLADRIGFTEIYRWIERGMEWADTHGFSKEAYTLEDVFALEQGIRQEFAG